MNILEFPGLGGLSLNINPILISIGSIHVYWYGVIIAAAFMLAVLLGLRDADKFDLDQDLILDVVLWAAPAAIIGARLYYVLFSWGSYKENPAEIFKLWNGGLAIYGGLLGAFITVFVYCRIKKLKPIILMDFAVPYIAMAQGIGRWGNFVNQEAYGTNTALPWGMTSDSIRRDLIQLQLKGVQIDPNLPVHPTFLYESLFNLCSFVFLLWLRKKKKFDGEVFLAYMALYGTARFFIEGLRTDSLMLGGLRISQALGLLFAIISVVLIFLGKRRSPNPVVAGDEAVQVSEASGVDEAVQVSEASRGNDAEVGEEGEGATKIEE